MTSPSISRFTSATAASTPVEDPFSAPVVLDDAEGYDFLTILKTLAEHRTESGSDHYHSFSLWGDGHASWEHEGTTCLHLAYTEETAPEVSAMLIDAGLFHYRIPIKDGRKKAVLFAFPGKDHFSHTDTTRAASILASFIGIKGVVKNSYFSTYFFRIQKGAVIEQHGDAIMNSDIIDDNGGLKVFIKEYLA